MDSKMSESINKSQSNINVGYYPSIYTVVRDNLTNADEWGKAEMRYLVEQFMQRVPGFSEVDLRNQNPCGTVELDLLEAIPDAMDKPLKVIFAELDALAIGAAKAANDWIAQVHGHLPALKARIDHLTAYQTYEYNYQKYPTLVHQEAYALLKDSTVMDVRGFYEPLPLAVATLVEHWEKATDKDAADYDRLLD